MADVQRSAFGTEMHNLRTRHDMSQKAAARHCGVSEPRWRQVELGYQTVQGVQVPTDPGPEFVVKVARGFDWDVRDALRLAGYNPDQVTIPDAPADTGQPPADLIELWGQLTQQQRQLIHNLARLFIDAGANVTYDQPEPTRSVPAKPARKRTKTEL